MRQYFKMEMETNYFVCLYAALCINPFIPLGFLCVQLIFQLSRDFVERCNIFMRLERGELDSNDKWQRTLLNLLFNCSILGGWSSSTFSGVLFSALCYVTPWLQPSLDNGQKRCLWQTTLNQVIVPCEFRTLSLSLIFKPPMISTSKIKD